MGLCSWGQSEVSHFQQVIVEQTAFTRKLVENQARQNFLITSNRHSFHFQRNYIGTLLEILCFNGLPSFSCVKLTYKQITISKGFQHFSTTPITIILLDSHIWTVKLASTGDCFLLRLLRKDSSKQTNKQTNKLVTSILLA